jgi:hypothetical protein
MARNLALGLAALLATTAAAEVALRLMTQPSELCYGRLLGVELPPCELPSPYAPPEETPREQPVGDLIVDGQRITVGDLWGIVRYDPVIGYVPQENAQSVNGWWITDGRGARVGRVPQPESESDQARMLVFGDSFAVGSRLPYEDIWSFVLDDESPEVSVTNFGMDGYSMAQSYLRYLSVRDSVEHDSVLLMFVPESDLWRDVNVRRDVAADWGFYWVMPRFAFVDGVLQLIGNPFGERDSAALPEPEETDRMLRKHLRKFDRLYVEDVYEPPSLLGRLVIHKALITAYRMLRKIRYRNSLQDTDSEAMRVSAAIFRMLAADAAARDERFVLAILPTAHELLTNGPAEWSRWQHMTSAVCGADLPCMDLSVGLREIPTAQIDFGYDGTHFGPFVNRRIADLLRAYLADGESRAE